VTTPSLEALQAYSLGIKASDVTNDYLAAIPFYQRAATFDPNFAMAYLRLAECYQPQGELIVAAENARKAYQLRDRTSDREKLHISAFYEYVVTGNLEAARKACDLFAQTYSRDEDARVYLWVVYTGLGDYEKAHRAAQDAFRINPASGNNLVTVMYADQWLNRVAEAKSTLQDARNHNVDSPWVAIVVYMLDFVQHDAVGMEQQAAAAMGIPGVEDQMLFLESETAACGGEFTKARELTRRAVDSARRAQEKETAAEYLGHNAVREAIVGNSAVAKEDAQSAIAVINGKNAEGFSAIAFALTGDAANANRLIDDLGKRFSQDTIVQFEYLPTARAGLALTTGNAADAVAALKVAFPYELGHTNNDFTFALYPVYLRGEAYLAAKNGTAAAGEFQKILDHSGVIGNEPIGALAHLGLGRAYALSSDSAKAKTAYQDFFALWKNADPDVPIVKEAKAEYAKLQ
jgi:tetratricopeptide (TPR) repeat protein